MERLKMKQTRKTNKIIFFLVLVLVFTFGFFSEVGVVEAFEKKDLFWVDVFLNMGPFTYTHGGWTFMGEPSLMLPNWWTKDSQDVFSYIVSPWQPPEKGEHCLDCNKLRYGCNEYQCRSFGAGCNLTNEGTEYEICYWSNQDDSSEPMISAMQSVLNELTPEVENDYHYEPFGNINSPNDYGVRIVYTGKNSDQKGCIPAFTNLILGVNTSEPAECKLDLERNTPYDEMVLHFKQGLVRIYDHTLELLSAMLLGPEELEELGYSIEDGLTYYIKCKDANGNDNKIDFVMKFCVQDSPDISPPEIKGTNLTECQGSAYLKSGETEKSFEVYTNKPITNCRWDFLDTNYGLMIHTMDFCTTEPLQFLSGTDEHGCRGTLTGLINNQNNIYLRCNDTKGNFNKQSCMFTLKQTDDLQIDSVTVNDLPNESVITDSTDIIEVTLKVKTSAGADNGKSKCEYNYNGGRYYFYNQGSDEYLTENIQENLGLIIGQYNFPIRCTDEANNQAESNIIFTLEQDNTEPIVVRFFHEEGYFRLITNEVADCVYKSIGVTDCDYPFLEGNSFETNDGINHFTDYTTENSLYIKCKDQYNNQPELPNCNVIVRGSEFYSG